MLSRLALDLDGPVLGVLDGGATLVDQSPKGRRGEYGRNTGATGTDTFCQSALEVQI